MSRGKVDITGVSTSELEVLSNEKMNELFIRLSYGDKSAKEELVNA